MINLAEGPGAGKSANGMGRFRYVAPAAQRDRGANNTHRISARILEVVTTAELSILRYAKAKSDVARHIGFRHKPAHSVKESGRRKPSRLDLRHSLIPKFGGVFDR